MQRWNGHLDFGPLGKEVQKEMIWHEVDKALLWGRHIYMVLFLSRQDSAL